MSKILVNSGEYHHLYNVKHIHKAFKNAFRGNSKDIEANKFTSNLGEELYKLYEDLSNKTYKPGKYRMFVRFESKRRIIEALPFRDRIAQHVLYDYIAPKYNNIFISTSYANRTGMGTQKGMLKEQEYLRKSGKGSWVLKGDIHHFFNSISPRILMNILAKKIKDIDILHLCSLFIPKRDKGIPIGNVTSQLYANIYLNEFDHYVKDVLRVKYYIRYMDDFVMNLSSKEEAVRILQLSKKFLREKLHLELNSKTQIFKENQGVNFLGGMIHFDHIKIRHSTVKNIKRKIRKYIKLYGETGDERIYFEKLYPSYNSWLGLIRYFCSKTIAMYLKRKLIEAGIPSPETYKKYKPFKKYGLRKTSYLRMSNFYSSIYIDNLRNR